MTGKVIMDEYADREPDFWITDMAPDGSFIRIAEVINIDLDKRVSSLAITCLHRRPDEGILVIR